MKTVFTWQRGEVQYSSYDIMLAAAAAAALVPARLTTEPRRDAVVDGPPTRDMGD